ncbi:sigma-70 family RNA polymerase sigma factor [Micromonospora sp. KC213]|uniref:sigma-70 family RNA polymerase sigma factor n=1 Tax=Micromonospora sp. KC213 TaxID=2530378 RepID=UPI00104BE48D|nr:sigma-70 family RNA polymerase sigma factor [Micromonospora sp. KC213]TDC43801.1 sigma-70 family RNA polymerase sigma factor [Micromonospora sp. KC213]
MSVLARDMRSIGAGEREQRMRVLFDANVGPLRGYLMRLTGGQREAADDLLQETMLRTWRKIDELPAGEESLRRWLFRVARNLTIDAARARQARPDEVSGDDVTWVPSNDVIDGVVDRHLLRDALLRLTPEHRAVLVCAQTGRITARWLSVDSRRVERLQTDDFRRRIGSAPAPTAISVPPIKGQWRFPISVPFRVGFRYRSPLGHEYVSYVRRGRSGG